MADISGTIRLRHMFIIYFLYYNNEPFISFTCLSVYFGAFGNQSLLELTSFEGVWVWVEDWLINSLSPRRCNTYISYNNIAQISYLFLWSNSGPRIVIQMLHPQQRNTHAHLAQLLVLTRNCLVIFNFLLDWRHQT